MTVDADDLPSTWMASDLASVSRINPPLDRCVLNDSIEVNFVPMRAVEPNGGGLAHPEVRSHGDVKKGYTSFLSGDVIMAKITPCMENGKTTVVPALPGEVCFGSTEFIVIRPEHGLDARWIAQFLVQHETRQSALRTMAGGVGQMRVPASFVESLRLPIAPPAEQERIVDTLDELFSDLDAAVAALERVRAKLKLYRASVLKAAVEGELTKDWRAQHPDAEPAAQLLQRILAERRPRWEEDQLAKFKAKGTAPPKGWTAKYQEPGVPDTSQQSALPQQWTRATMAQLGEVGTGATPNRGMRALYYEGGSFPWVTSACVNAPLVREPSEFVTAAAMRECNLTLYPAGTLLLAMYGEGKTRGKCAELAIESTTNQALAAVQRLGALGPYVKLFLHKHYQDLRRVASGGVQPNLSLERVREIEVPLPPLAEQEAIVELVEDQLSVIDHLEADLDAKLKSAQALRQAILRRAFAGKLVPQDPKDEPAAELLKRIAAERASSAQARPATKRRGVKGKAA